MGKTTNKYTVSRYFVAIALLLSVTWCFAQTGTIKIYSEFPNVDIYLDETLIGKDINTIDSVAPGTHYLKGVYGKATIYGELLKVNPEEVTTVLIKDTKEVREKIIQSYYKEIQQYLDNKLDVMLSSKYVTQTSGVTSSMYFPGYYVVTGTSYSYSSSTTKQVLDWFVVKGGKTKVSDWELARLAGDEDITKRIESEMRKIDEWNHRLWKRQERGVTIGAVATITGLVALSDVLIADWLPDEISATILALSAIIAPIGFATANSGHERNYPDHFITIEEAKVLVERFNSRIKKSIGIPDIIDIK